VGAVLTDEVAHAEVVIARNKKTQAFRMTMPEANVAAMKCATPFRVVLPVLFLLAGCSRSEEPVVAPAKPAPVVEEVPHVQTFFESGDHVVLIGGGLADRMQHDGWLESVLQPELVGLDVTFRNQGYTGDRIDHRPRNSGFLSSDEYLALSKATVVVAMFGYNASFDEDPGGFKSAVVKWVEHTRAQDYSGAGAPRIVLVSPTAAEDLGDPNLADASVLNRRLARTAAAMEKAAEEVGVRYVDLFTPTLHHFSMDTGAQTINGVHLNPAGNRVAAEALAEALLGYAPDAEDTDLEVVRAAVLDKNWHWYSRYRATDGNDVWGSRASLSFTDGQTNRDVLQNELVQLDVMTQNRDKVVWAAARGEVIAPDDTGVPPAVEVISNLDKPQEQGGISKIGDGTYLGGKEAMDKMTLEEGLSVNLFASEGMFPELVNPVQMGVGPRGRLWVAAWRTYPKWQPLQDLDDRLLILPDEDRDGVADRAITFAHVHNPTGFAFWNGGVIVAAAPDLLFLKDTDGDDVADMKVHLLGGIDSADTHHTMNNFVVGPDGFLYYQRGVFHVSNVETPWQANQESTTSGMYRFNPRTFEFSFHASNSPNPHGISFDYWGYHYATDGTGGAAFQVVPAGNGKFKMRKLLDHTVRPVASSGILSSPHFPAKFQGNFLLCNTIAFLGLKQYTLAFDTVTGEVTGTQTDDFLVSTDPNFRPTDLEVGDDGALYISDWANAIIGHMQHNVRDPKRDHAHGRVYRVTADGQSLADHIAVVGQPTEQLLELLRSPTNGLRERVRSELSTRDSREVIAAADTWSQQFDIHNMEDAHPLLEVLWLHQQHNIENRELLGRLLNSPEPNARLAAQRVQMMWDHQKSAPTSIDAAGADGEDAMPTPPEGAIVLSTVPEEMRYDLKSFEVKAGSTVKLWFQNLDYMPHNVVIGTPGSAEVLGPLAEALGAKGFETGFIPTSDKLLAHSKLLNHRKAELIEFTAPSEVGDCDFICTFPGHWRLMRGVMHVVE